MPDDSSSSSQILILYSYLKPPSNFKDCQLWGYPFRALKRGNTYNRIYVWWQLFFKLNFTASSKGCQISKDIYKTFELHPVFRYPSSEYHYFVIIWLFVATLSNLLILFSREIYEILFLGGSNIRRQKIWYTWYSWGVFFNALRQNFVRKCQNCGSKKPNGNKINGILTKDTWSLNRISNSISISVGAYSLGWPRPPQYSYKI